ncbi:MAG TPA: ABC transporter ATP-binding protein [Deltaproteobacteria bacterium]|nr:ABC transporter ATP-binding protein [Deltaproteobacteria bacterium]HCP44557.1 ABC transporter ATP-binding protein [Deltaproteobacteria bacterium]|tara:strand:- start:621 stop:1412 length:792 start_codon:yes stop_codon:yes gene_type:complete
MPTLEIANLEVVYHSVVRVLSGISLVVPEGSIVALLGPNGAGKTTTLRAITGLLPLHDGEVVRGSIQLDDNSLVNLEADAIVRSGLAQVLEGRRVLVDLSVEENLLAGAWSLNRSQASDRVDHFCARFPILGERRHHLAGYLSGGEQQMVAIARALMPQPEIVLLDEPSLGLAPRIVDEVVKLIREIRESGVSVLLVEQNASMALDLADAGYVLENGRIVASGTAEELRGDADIREFYLGLGSTGSRGYRDVKHYRRKRRWLS